MLLSRADLSATFTSSPLKCDDWRSVVQKSWGLQLGWIRGWTIQPRMQDGQLFSIVCDVTEAD